MRNTRSNFMHLMRWIAALLVVISHLRSVLFTDYRDLSNSSHFTKIFYLATSIGHESVIVFFVLSGYLISNSIITQVAVNEFNFYLYFINRISRLYSVLLAALVLTVILDLIGLHFDNIGLYSNSLHIATVNFSVIDRLSVYHFISSLCMLQNITVPPLGSNGPLWSLNYEFWYYVLFPSLYIPLQGLKKQHFSKQHIILLLISLSIIVLLPIVIFKYFFIWLIGLIPIFVLLKGRFYKYFFFVSFLSFVVAKLANMLPLNEFHSDLVIAILFSFWLCTFERNSQKFKTKTQKLIFTVNERVASFSYTTYLVHLPLILCLSSILHFSYGYGIKMSPSVNSYFIFSVFLVIIYLFSFVVASFTEFRTKDFKEILSRKLPRQVKV